MSEPVLPRDEFAVTRNFIYFNHAAVGVLPASSRAALDGFIGAHAERGVMGTFGYEARMPQYRERIAGFIGAKGSEIAILRNTGDGANAIGGGIDWQPGDEVLLCANEFPANAIPWLALRERGVNVRLLDAGLRMTPGVLEREIGERTRVVTVSWVAFDDGYRHDLAALAEVAHASGAWLCVDAIQGLGAFPLDVRACGIDALYAGGAKWMLALQGVSFLYVREDMLARLTPAAPGWRSQSDMWDFLNYAQPYADDASRFEGGTPNFLGALSLERSVDLFERHDRAATAGHILALTDRLCEGLQRMGANVRTQRAEGISSGIVTFSLDGCDSVTLGKAIQREGAITTWRPSGIRVSPHAYNTQEEIDRFLELVPLCARAQA